MSGTGGTGGVKRGRGRPPLKPDVRTRTRSYSLREEEHAALAAYARARGLSDAGALREILRPRLVELGLLQAEGDADLGEEAGGVLGPSLAE